MENNKLTRDFTPVFAIPPGDSIRENMTLLGMNQEELAARLGITTKHLSNVLNGNAPITYETALRLESVIGASAEFWMNLETLYQLNKARIEHQEELSAELGILKDIRYNKMSEYGWVDKTTDKMNQIRETRAFFGVAKLNFIETSYAVAYRKQLPKRDISNLGVLAWLRKAETDGLEKEVSSFSKRNLKMLIPKFRELTLLEPSVFFPKMEHLCASAGVALVLVECLPTTYVCGATIWRNKRVVLALSIRGKKSDIFWLTFFRELAHLISHSYKDFHINFEQNSHEDEADEIVRNYLISKEEYEKFIKNYPSIKKDDIVTYAAKIGIASSILLCRLQHDGYVSFADYNDLKHLLKILSSAVTTR